MYFSLRLGNFLPKALVKAKEQAVVYPVRPPPWTKNYISKSQSTSIIKDFITCNI